MSNSETNALEQPENHDSGSSRSVSNDPHRPAYHFLPPANWMNDANGLIQWKGVYHIFYQYNPNGPLWGTIHWSHATSTDLVHWTHLPIALAPTTGSPDEDGCWSGCAVDNAETPTIIYTGVRGGQERPCLATSVDELVTWQKYPHNPLIAGPPPGLDLVGFRDHCIWKEGDDWYQIIGAGIKGAGGAILLYRSTNLLHWHYLHPLLVDDAGQLPSRVTSLSTGTMWECPDFFSLGSADEERILTISIVDNDHGWYPGYFTGTYSMLDQRFTPQQFHKLDYGASFYAPQSLRDDRGRRIMWGWLREERNDEAQLEAGWSGAMSLPRILSLRPDGTLDMRPAPELEMLRGRHWSHHDMVIDGDSENTLAGLGNVSGDKLEILAEFEPDDAREIGLAVRCSPDRQEQTVVLYDSLNGQLAIDTMHSSLSGNVRPGRHAGPLHLASGERLRLRIFVDHSVIEVFGNEHACATSRVYPTRPDSLGISLFTHGGKARLVSLDVWEMASIW